MGCKFTEYRGEGRPVVGILSVILGDVYFNIKEQLYTVWAYQPNSRWRQWRFMTESKDCKHPKLEWILYPIDLHFSWVPMSSYNNYLRQMKLRLGRWINAINTHIRIILDDECGVKPASLQIEAPSLHREMLPDSSDDDDEVEELAQLAMISSDSVKNILNKIEAEIMAEVHADLDNCCKMIHVQSNNIQKALTTSSSMWYIHEWFRVTGFS